MSQSHDGREEALLSFILAHPDIKNIKGNPSRMLQAIDEFSATHDFLISIGAHKAKILSDLIAKEKPAIVVELGGYLGYSAILFADAMRKAPSSTESKIRVWSLEMSPEFATIAEKLIEIAGLSALVTVVVGPAEESLRKLKEEGNLKDLDMLFLDHAEELYVSDFKVRIFLHLSSLGWMSGKRLGIENTTPRICLMSFVYQGCPSKHITDMTLVRCVRGLVC
jgi:catechol O-methyltransferase